MRGKLWVPAAGLPPAGTSGRTARKRLPPLSFPVVPPSRFRLFAFFNDHITIKGKVKKTSLKQIFELNVEQKSLVNHALRVSGVGGVWQVRKSRKQAVQLLRSSSAIKASHQMLWNAFCSYSGLRGNAAAPAGSTAAGAAASNPRPSPHLVSQHKAECTLACSRWEEEQVIEKQARDAAGQLWVLTAAVPS